MQKGGKKLFSGDRIIRKVLPLFLFWSFVLSLKDMHDFINENLYYL